MNHHDTPLQLRAGKPIDLAQYIATQLNNLFPECGIKSDVDRIIDAVPLALDRMRPILAAVRAFENHVFDHFNSMQYASFLHILGNEHWKANGMTSITHRLFYLNKTLNTIDLFGTISMPEVFFISHGMGSVIGNARYGNKLVIFQNVTVGRVGDDRPTIGENVILYSGAVITGKSIIGNNSIISAGTVLHDAEVPDNVVVFKNGKDISFKPLKKDFLSLYIHPQTTLSN